MLQQANLRISTDKPDAFPWVNLLTTETAKFRPAGRIQYFTMIYSSFKMQ
jgi:hypothetical protein